MKKAKGFTLIELMIVVVILGILATCAIPAYQNHVVRARVVEGLSLVTSAKMVVTEYLIAHNGEPGGSGLGAGYQSPQPTENVSSIVIDKNTGDITITFTPIAGNGTIVFHPSMTPSGEVTWACNEGTLAAKYRPETCK
ncbi:MAG TPA: pilin [Legionellaceae bacterium]|nr:pilin [Legionellaceae bacterium]